MCLSNQELKSILATNGKYYEVCLSYILVGIFKDTKVFVYADVIKTNDGSGYLIKTSSVPILYEFVPNKQVEIVGGIIKKKIITTNGNGGKINGGNGANGKEDFFDKLNADPWIKGIDNSTLLLIGAGLLLLSRD